VLFRSKSKQECETFCNNPDNSETCFNFGRDNGLISQEDLQKMEQGKQQMQQSFSNMPAEVSQCLTSALGADTVEKMKNGAAMPSQNMGEQMQKCFEQFMPRMDQRGEQGTNQQGPMKGPGGCQSSEECQKYCANNPQECQNSGSQQNQNQMPPKQTGPGGCQSPEECEAYCKNNPQECQGAGQQQPTSGFKEPNFQQQPGQFGPMPQQGQEGQFNQQYQPGQMMPQQSGQPGEFQPKELNQMMPPQNQQSGQFIQGENQIMQQFQTQYMTVPQEKTGQFFQPQSQTQQYQQFQQQPMMPQGDQQFMPQQPPQDMTQQPQFQPQQPMTQEPGSGIAPPPPPTSEPAPQPAPQPESAPSTMNSNNLFGMILKPFVKIFGL